MIDVRKTIIQALEPVDIEVYYDQFVTDVTMPCISYTILDDAVNKQSDTVGYSNLTVRIKVWDTSVSDLATKMSLVDSCLRSIGLKRTSYNELVSNELIIGVSNYSGFIREIFD